MGGGFRHVFRALAMSRKLRNVGFEASEVKNSAFVGAENNVKDNSPTDIICRCISTRFVNLTGPIGGIPSRKYESYLSGLDMRSCSPPASLSRTLSTQRERKNVSGRVHVAVVDHST